MVTLLSKLLSIQPTLHMYTYYLKKKIAKCYIIIRKIVYYDNIWVKFKTKVKYSLLIIAIKNIGLRA